MGGGHDDCDLLHHFYHSQYTFLCSDINDDSGPESGCVGQEVEGKQLFTASCKYFSRLFSLLCALESMDFLLHVKIRSRGFSWDYLIRR